MHCSKIPGSHWSFINKVFYAENVETRIHNETLKNYGFDIRFTFDKEAFR
mgnify:CR=1 FL=1